jgi:hypothetical protein
MRGRSVGQCAAAPLQFLGQAQDGPVLLDAVFQTRFIANSRYAQGTTLPLWHSRKLRGGSTSHKFGNGFQARLEADCPVLPCPDGPHRRLRIAENIAKALRACELKGSAHTLKPLD